MATAPTLDWVAVPSHVAEGPAGVRHKDGWLVCEVSADSYAHLIAATPELLAALKDLYAFVGVMVGRGPDASIPETVTTPIGLPVKIGAIMRDAEAALSKAEPT